MARMIAALRTPALAFLVLTALSGCQTTGPPPATDAAHVTADGLVTARLGRTVSVGGPKVTPLRVVEDSRCPTGVRCVWAGRVRLTVRIDLGSGSQTRELTQGQPIPVADGTLELVTVAPDRTADPAKPGPKPLDYRFGLRFMGGL